MENNKTVKKGVLGAYTVFILLIFILIIDLLRFNAKPWPYASGADVEYVFLAESVFFIQYIEHCHFFEPKFFAGVVLTITPIFVSYFATILGSINNNDTLSREWFNEINTYYIPFLVVFSIFYIVRRQTLYGLALSSLASTLIFNAYLLVFHNLFAIVISRKFKILRSIGSVVVLFFFFQFTRFFIAGYAFECI